MSAKTPKIETVSSTNAPNGDIDREELLNAIGGRRQSEAPKAADHEFDNEAIDTAAPESINPFDDIDSLRVKQDFAQAAGRKALTIVPVRRPGKQTFVRVRSEPEYRRTYAILEMIEERELYVVASSMQGEFLHGVTSRTFYTAMTRQGTLFLWPVKNPDPGSIGASWAASDHINAREAMTRWVRTEANKEAGCWELFPAEGELPEPEWPDYPFEKIMEAAFRERPIIRSFDHPVIKRLRGLV